MRIKIDRPAPGEWVISDPYSCSHYYARLFPSGFMYQLIIAELGLHKGMYEFPCEIFSCTFFAKDPNSFSENVLSVFMNCPDLSNPVALAYDFGGSLGSDVPTPRTYSGVLQ